mgnify:CR=1 FL=1
MLLALIVASSTLALDIPIVEPPAYPASALTDGTRSLEVVRRALGVYGEARSRWLGPIEIRLSSGASFFSSKSADDREVSGQQHDLHFDVALPFDLGVVELIPDLGYTALVFSASPSQYSGWSLR